MSVSVESYDESNRIIDCVSDQQTTHVMDIARRRIQQKPENDDELFPPSPQFLRLFSERGVALPASRLSTQ